MTALWCPAVVTKGCLERLSSLTKIYIDLNRQHNKQLKIRKKIRSRPPSNKNTSRYNIKIHTNPNKKTSQKGYHLKNRSIYYTIN